MSNDSIYDQFQIKLSSYSNREKAYRLLNNNYDGSEEAYTLRMNDIAALQATGEAWAGIFKYVNYITESQYPAAYQDLLVALEYFKQHGFPSTGRGHSLFETLVSIINDGGLSAFQQTGELHYSAPPPATFFSLFIPANGSASTHTLPPINSSGFPPSLS